MREISILIPTYNDECVRLAATLQQQAQSLGIAYEIIVADDGSTNRDVIERNRDINQLPHCQLIERPKNAGRAAIRNFLARQARHEWLLFIDGDMVVCHEDYIRRYAEAQGEVVDGGVVIRHCRPRNLRSMYEKAHEHEHVAEKRQQTPYQDFHTANFMIRRTLFLAHPFDERFQHYGYEDVLFGKTLQQDHIDIIHIDNPMSFERFEENGVFVSKTEEGLRTLWHFREELKGYSRMLDFRERIGRLAPLLRLWHQVFGHLERRIACSTHPSLRVFDLYRIGYFISMKQ